MSTQFIKEIEKLLKASKFSFTVTEHNSLECTYNEGKGTFKIPLPYCPEYPDTKDGIAEKQSLQHLVSIFKDHPNRISGTFPVHILEAAKDAPPKAKKPYKVTNKAVYINTATWQTVTGEIDLSSDTVKKAKEIECDLLPDVLLIYHPKVGQGVSLVFDGHLIAGHPLPEFNSDDYVMNFIDSILQIGIDKVMSKAKELAKRRAEQIEAGETESTYRHECKAIRALLAADELMFDSWGAEHFVYTKDEHDRPALLFSVNGFLHVGQVEIVAAGEAYEVYLIEKGHRIGEKQTATAGELAELVDRLVEHSGDQAEYIKKCEALNIIVESEVRQTVSEAKVA